MKVIFLDIDGVLQVLADYRDEYGDLFRPHFVNNLAKIIEATEAKIVTSSAWRKSGLNVMKEMWKDRSLPGEVIGITPIFTMGDRGCEIRSWMKKVFPTHYPNDVIERYIIIDDMDEVLEEQRPFFIHCDELEDEDAIMRCGLVSRLTEKAIKLLND